MSFVPVLGRPDLTLHDGMRCMPAELGDMINNGGVAVAAGQTIASAASSVIAGSSPARSYPEPDGVYALKACVRFLFFPVEVEHARCSP